MLLPRLRAGRDRRRRQPRRIGRGSLGQGPDILIVPGQIMVEKRLPASHSGKTQMGGVFVRPTQGAACSRLRRRRKGKIKTQAR